MQPTMSPAQISALKPGVTDDGITIQFGPQERETFLQRQKQGVLLATGQGCNHTVLVPWQEFTDLLSRIGLANATWRGYNETAAAYPREGGTKV